MTWAEVRQRTFAALQEGRIQAPYDYLIVDEAQDIAPHTLQMLAAMVSHAGGFYVTADVNQTLYDSSFSWDALKEGWPQADIHVLKRNYRNTAPIVRALDDIREALSMQDEAAALEESMRDGPLPQVIHTTEENKIDALIQYLQEASHESLEPLRYAAILVAGDRLHASREGKQLAKALKARKIKANFMSSKDLRLDADCIKIITMYTSKGLEFPIVALWNVNEGVLPRDISHLPHDEMIEEELKDRRLFYVGCSRAMRNLAVFTTQGEESELLYDLQDEHWNKIYH